MKINRNHPSAPAATTTKRATTNRRIAEIFSKAAQEAPSLKGRVSVVKVGSEELSSVSKKRFK